MGKGTRNERKEGDREGGGRMRQVGQLKLSRHQGHGRGGGGGQEGKNNSEKDWSVTPSSNLPFSWMCSKRLHSRGSQ